MRISVYDRLQAIARIPEYRKDFEEYRNKAKDPLAPIDMAFVGPPDDLPNLMVRLRSEEAIALCRKYDIPYPIDPNFDLNLLNSPEVFSSYLGPPVVFPFNRPEETGIFVPDKETGLVEGRYLPVLIDLTQPKEAIFKEFERILTRILKSSKERSKDTEVNIWQVYDLHCLQGKSLLEVTRELFGISGLPAYYNEADRRYQQIKRACDKAQQIVQKVSSLYCK